MAQIDDYQKQYDAINSVLPNDDGSFTVNGVRLSASKYKNVKSEAKTRLDAEKKRISSTTQTTSETERLRKEVQIDTLVLAGENLPKNLAAYQGSGAFDPVPNAKRKIRLEQNKKKLEEGKKNLKTLSTVAPASAADFRKVEGFTPSKTDAQKKKEEKKKNEKAPGAVTNKVGDSRVVSGVTEKWDGKKWVPEKKVAAAVVDWKPKFREMFPYQSWLLDLDSTKYSGLFKLLETGVKDQMWLTPESQARFAGQLQGTDFYVELKTNDTVKNITSLVGDLGFDTVPFNTFLKDTMNFGWKDDTLKQKVYEEAFRKDPATGNYVNATTVERVRKSSPYLTVANIGKAFFSTVSDSTIAGVLTGSMIQDDVVRQQRELAKGKYGHLSNLIDQGLSLADISDSYKTQASKLLEKDVNSIDMSQGAYSQAFDFGEEGKKRLMSTSEWETKLRSDATFGWDKTQNARDEARALASSISQAFGRVI
jgi:hypothetical protein